MFGRPSRRHDAGERGQEARRALTCAAVGLALSGAFTAQASAKTRSLSCRGGAAACTAVVGVGGGASNETLGIALTDTDLKLVGIVARPAFIHGAYLLSGGSYLLGGSLYTVTLNAVQSIPRGATLTLRFASPARELGCQSVTRSISYLAIAALPGSRRAGGGLSCQQANAVGNTWALRFKARQQVESFSVNDVRYTCRLISTLPQNTQCDGGGTRIRFSAPTG
jgi:hypothetical protein